MQAAPANISASPRQAPGGETDRLAPKAIATPPMASTRPTLLRRVRRSIPRRAATNMVIRGVVERASAPRKRASRPRPHLGLEHRASVGCATSSKRSQQPTCADGAPLWVKMVALRAGLAEPLDGDRVEAGK